MDIRTKLIFALVVVSLGSMFVLGLVVSPRVEGYIRGGSLDRLDQVAEAKSESLRWIIAGWRDGTDLVASRTQLRANTAEYARTRSPGTADRIRTILSDALVASRSAVLLEVYGTDRRSIAAAQRRTPVPAIDPDAPPPPPGDAVYAGVRVAGGLPQVTFLAPMSDQGQTVGTLVAVFEAPELLHLVASHYGLGDTGETLILAEDGTSGLRTLHPTRHDESGNQGVSLPDGPDGLGRLALSDSATALAGGVTDYRGEEVWAATRRVPDTGWGLVVKMDRAEGLQPVVEFNAWLRQAAIILSAFAIVVGLGLGLRFALPIHALAAVANRIRGGDMGARANAEREDEVGLLARTFNEMADDLERRMAQLHEFRRFFDVAIDMMCLAGTDGYFKLLNPAFERELGWTREELLERPFLDFVHPDDVEKTVQEVARLAEGIPTISFENRYRCKDGRYKHLRWTSHPEGDLLYAIAHVVEGA